MNHNLIISSIKFKKVNVFMECGWKLSSKKDVFHNIITTKKEIIDSYSEKFIKMNELNVFQILEYKRFNKLINNYIEKILYPTITHNITNEEKKIYGILCDEILILFINYYKDSKNIKEKFIPFDETCLERKNVIFS